MLKPIFRSFVVLAAITAVGSGCSSSSSKSDGSAGAGGSAGEGGVGGSSGAGGADGSAGADGAVDAASVVGDSGAADASDGGAIDGNGADATGTTSLQNAIQTIVVIYAENRTFDNMFGNFPGAHGLGEVVDAQGHPTASYVPQKDRDGTTVLSKLPKTWGGVTLAGNPTVVTEAQSDGLANAPFGIENAYVGNGAPTLGTLDVTRDLTHRFFENQMEINGGSNDMFAAWLDAGGLAMGHFDTSQSKLYKLAQDYVLADNFYSGAFGGSFLNHQYLVCACAPSAPMDFITKNAPAITTLGTPNAKGVPQLELAMTSPASALTGPPAFAHSTAIAPLDYFGTGDGYRAINTIQPAYEPSGNAPAATATDLHFADAASSSTLPPLTAMTVGDQLTTANVNWAWYATSWDAATTDGMQASTAPRKIIYTPSTARGTPDFQPHHQPYNYYARFDPVAHPDDRTAHPKVRCRRSSPPIRPRC